MSASDDGASGDGRGLATMRELRLDSIILWECGVERGEATNNTPGELKAEVKVDHAFSDGGGLQYTVGGTYEFSNEEDERLATITASFVLEYTNSGDGEITSELASKFARSVVMQVTPFQRELLATLSNRLAMPPFYLPLMRRSGSEVVSDTVD